MFLQLRKIEGRSEALAAFRGIFVGCWVFVLMFGCAAVRLDGDAGLPTSALRRMPEALLFGRLD